MCWVVKKKQHNLGLPTFKLPASTTNLGYRTEFSCLYVYVTGYVWPYSTDEYEKF